MTKTLIIAFGLMALAACVHDENAVSCGTPGNCTAPSPLPSPSDDSHDD